MTGFVLGTTPSCAKSPCTSMLRTRDAGRTWTGIPAPVVATTPAADSAPMVDGLAFADAKNGFAFGRGLYATHDGGATWHTVGVGTNGVVSSLVAGGDSVYAVYGNDGGTLVSGPASGDVFSPVTGVDLTQGSGAQITAHGKAVYVTARRTSSSAPPLFYASADGRTFVGRATPCTKGFLDDFTVAASGDSNLAAVCGSEPATAMQDKRAFVSSDAGRHWTRVGDPPGVSGTYLVATGKGTFLTDSRIGMEVTRDGGRTWPYAFKDSGGGTHAVGFVNDDLGFLLDQQAMYVSRDAGATWRKVAF